MQPRARAIIESAVSAQPAALLDATVRRPPRSRVFVAIYSGPEPGQQIARSTGQRDYASAMAQQARGWEAEARRAREARKAAGQVSGSRRGMACGRISTRLLEEYSKNQFWPEGPDPLTPQEVEALLGLATTWLERRVVWNVLDLIGQQPAQGGHG